MDLSLRACNGFGIILWSGESTASAGQATTSSDCIIASNDPEDRKVMALPIPKHTVPKVHFHYLVWLRNNWRHFLTSAILLGVSANVFQSYNKVSLLCGERGAFGFQLQNKKKKKKKETRPKRNGITYLNSSMFLVPPFCLDFLWTSYRMSVWSAGKIP